MAALNADVYLFHLQNLFAAQPPRVLQVLSVDSLEQRLDTFARMAIDQFVLRADAQVQVLFRLDLVGALLVARALAPEPELQNLVAVQIGALLLGMGFDGRFDDLLHVDSLGSDDPASDLELLLVLDLDIVAACQLVLLRIYLGRSLGVLFVIVRHVEHVPLDLRVIIRQKG